MAEVLSGKNFYVVAFDSLKLVLEEDLGDMPGDIYIVRPEVFEGRESPHLTVSREKKV